MRLFMVVAVILFGLSPVFAEEKAAKIYTNQDLEKYKTNAGNNSDATAKSFPHAGFSKCFELDSLSGSQLKSFLGELDSMREYYMSKSVSDDTKQGILRSIKTCRQKVAVKLKTKKDQGSQRAFNHM